MVQALVLVSIFDHPPPSLTEKGFWVQMSGGTLVAGPEIQEKRYGEYSDEVWDDIRDVVKIKSMIQDSPSREVERLLLSSSSESIRTALIVGPMIYGLGNGPCNRRSIQAPEIAKAILKDGRGFRFNAGLNRWSTIHVSDLGDLLNRLVQSASTGDAVDEHLWNVESVYFPATGIVVSKALYMSVSFLHTCRLLGSFVKESHSKLMLKDSSRSQTYLTLLTPQEPTRSRLMAQYYWGRTACSNSQGQHRLRGGIRAIGR